MSGPTRPAEDSGPARAGAAGLLEWLGQPVDIASLAVFRVLFGLFAAGEAYRLVATNVVYTLWMSTPVFFPWPGFGWLPKLPGLGMAVHFYLVALIGLAVAGGLGFRVACVLLALGFAYPILLCETTVVAEFYLIIVLALLLAFTSANRVVSADSWLRPRSSRPSARRVELALLRAQFTIVQVWMGLWMLDSDWLRGSPLLLWLPERSGFPMLGELHRTAPLIVALSWLLALAFVAAPLALWWRRTRNVALVTLSLLIIWLEQCFSFGAFPWLLLVGNLLFLPPDWPRRVLNWPRTAPIERAPGARVAPAAAALAAAWLLFHALFPLRGALSPGDSRWTERGARFSWRVPGTAKAGALSFSIRNPETHQTRSLDPKEELSEWQYGRVASNPALLRRYARGISLRETAPGAEPLEVRALTLISLNGREPQRLVDPEVDLVQAEPPGLLSGAEWILPLDVPLDQQWQTDAKWPPPRDVLTTRRGRISR